MNIADLPNCPAWLQEATTHNADVSLDAHGEVTWHGGDFLDGEFLGGYFLGGSFLGGSFLGGLFQSGEFWGGEFMGGYFLDAPLVASASVRSNGHGECGRTLYAIQTTATTHYRCGRFWGSRADLESYIAAEEDRYAKSRRAALRCVDVMLSL